MVYQKKEQADKNHKSRLREAAESKLSTSSRKIPGLEGKSIDEIIHELEVHQIELEIDGSVSIYDVIKRSDERMYASKRLMKSKKNK